jgi:hypothetical protein
VLEQIRRDSERLEGNSLVVGPFARLDANRVAAADDKTRGAITNLFGSQAAFQADTMARALSASDLIEGAWLNQCLTTRHPADPSEPIAAVLRRSGRLFWRGATRPRAAPAP